MSNSLIIALAVFGGLALLAFALLLVAAWSLDRMEHPDDEDWEAEQYLEHQRHVAASKKKPTDTPETMARRAA